nr:hypothetical protein [uncultured Desulfobacter sp.]
MKHKVSTLRNIAQTPPYAHNGFFPNLTSIVQFYNTRDVYKCSVVGGIPEFCHWGVQKPVLGPIFFSFWTHHEKTESWYIVGTAMQGISLKLIPNQNPVHIPANA